MWLVVTFCVCMLSFVAICLIAWFSIRVDVRGNVLFSGRYFIAYLRIFLYKVYADYCTGDLMFADGSFLCGWYIFGDRKNCLFAYLLEGGNFSRNRLITYF